MPAFSGSALVKHVTNNVRNVFRQDIANKDSPSRAVVAHLDVAFWIGSIHCN